MSKDKRTLPTTENAHQNTKQNDSIIISCGIELKKQNDILSVSTRVIADGAGINHKSVVNLINKHSEHLESHGDYVVFKIRDKSKSGREQEAFLNESQATFLMTLLQNTKQVVEFKSSLVKAYEKTRRDNEILTARNTKLEYVQNRELGKLHRRDLTDEIKPFIEYAEKQGSKGSHFLYTNITKWINSACGVDSVENASESELANVSTACDIAMNTIHAGITKAQNYKIIKNSIKSKLEIFGSLHRVGDA